MRNVAPEYRRPYPLRFQPCVKAFTLDWLRESEARIWRISTTQQGDWSWGRNRRDSNQDYQSRFASRLGLSGSLQEYVRGDAYLLASGDIQSGYAEWRVRPDDGNFLTVHRDFQGTAGVGAGFGRRRDVTPIIQAERLSERLRALGRDALSGEQILELAAVLARQGGFDKVFDRPDRHLWRDVLEPILAGGAPLSPYEVLYLRDMLSERLGSRGEGSTLEAGVSATRTTQTGSRSMSSTRWGPRVTARWSHNLSLDRQLSILFSGSFNWADGDSPPDDDSEQGSGLLTLAHLWVLADRVYWNTYLQGQFSYLEHDSAPSTVRQREVTLGTSYSIYVEDRMTLEPNALVGWTRIGTADSGSVEHFTWTLGVGFSYDLENALF